MMRDIKLLVRQEGDITDTRMKNTASIINTISQNKTDFKAKWSAVKIDERSALSSETADTKKGCLSDIPSGAGTNRNERLHRSLNA